MIIRKDRDSLAGANTCAGGRVCVQIAVVIFGLLFLGVCFSYAQVAGQGTADAAGEGEQVPATAKADGQSILTGESTAMLGGATKLQLKELLRKLGQQIQSSKGYVTLAQLKDSSPEAKAASDFDLLANYELTGPGERRFLQLGIQLFDTQPDHLFVQGYQESEGKYSPNPDIAAVLEMVQVALKDTATPQNILPRDLATMVYQLNYVSGSQALEMLKVMGYRVVSPVSFQPDQGIDRNNLPLVCKMPDPEQTWLAGATTSKGARGIMRPGEAIQKFDKSTTGGPLERLLIMHDPDSSRRPAFVRLLELLRTQIDVPARRLLIEGMVLEVSETGIDQLGIQYDLGRFDAAGTNARASASFQTAAGQTVRPLMLTFDSSIDAALDRYRVVLRALIRDGEAQVLSRPSILALDNRQARIRVTTEVPVSSTAVTELTTEIKVEYISVGIVLNIRPRINAGGEDVSFQIDASVSDIDATSPYRIEIDPESLTGAQAPVVLTRQVQTYARILNNTPLIIGGLIAKRTSTELDRVPFLSDIPIIGWLFKNRDYSTERREVIIVLTPYVLPEQTDVSRAMPKDSDLFDEIDPLLFRATYRIRIQDVFDLSFLKNNSELNELRMQAKELVRTRPDLADNPLFEAVIQKQAPGERILVERMVYEIIKKLGLTEKLTPSNLLFFKHNPSEPAGFQVQFISEELGGKRVVDLDEYFEKHPHKAMAMTFEVPKETETLTTQVFGRVVPQVSLLELKDRQEWGKKLYELNQPLNGVPRWTIIINSPKDMERLKTALILKRTVDLNKTDEGFQLKHFQVGRQLTFPVVDPQRTYLINWEVAKYFYHTEHYYAAFQKELSRTMSELRREISRQRSGDGYSREDTEVVIPHKP